MRTFKLILSIIAILFAMIAIIKIGWCAFDWYEESKANTVWIVMDKEIDEYSTKTYKFILHCKRDENGNEIRKKICVHPDVYYNTEIGNEGRYEK